MCPPSDISATDSSTTHRDGSQLSDYDYLLPEELIAQYPLAQRSASRLLHVDGQGQRQDLVFTNVLQLLKPNDLIVFNDTKVIKARLHAQKATGGRVELLVERIDGTHTALVQLKASHKPTTGAHLRLEQAGKLLETGVTLLERNEQFFRVQFDQPVFEVLDAYGELPLPPYIEHTPDAQDDTRYQTVYATHPGAVAAPTAGLHFDEALLNALSAQGVQQARVTLHVGAGTFQPVRTENIAEHTMHSEWYEVPQATVDAIARCRAQGGRVVAVGTTSVRSLESAAHVGVSNRTPVSAQGDTQIFITPGFEYQVVDALITNFHLPKSTLLMLVGAFIGLAPMRAAYAHAVANKYRFFSYGDAMFLERNPHAV